MLILIVRFKNATELIHFCVFILNLIVFSLITLHYLITCVIFIYNTKQILMTPEAERFNGWAAMLGFVAAVGAYVTTGQIIPGWF